jgi:hypothetical protein
MTCPSCGSSEIRASRHAHWSDVFERVRGQVPLRCRKCRHRFYALKSMAGKELASRSRHSARRTKLINIRKMKRFVSRVIMIGIIVVLMFIFLFFLNALSMRRMSEQDSGANSNAIVLLADRA